MYTRDAFRASIVACFSEDLIEIRNARDFVLTIEDHSKADMVLTLNRNIIF